MSQFASSADFFARTLAQPEEREQARKLTFAEARASWSPDSFAREQVRGLVRQLFLSGNEKRVRHVLFSAIDRETDIESITRLVAEGLALENVGSVAVLGPFSNISREDSEPVQVRGEGRRSETAGLRTGGLRLRENLWLLWRGKGSVPNAPNVHASVCELRREFDYSIMAGPAADSPEGMAMVQMVDGVVLVISARHTRKATALSVKRALQLANPRILGTVLIDREFPIPASIYRRL
jgi:hypothetical protein